MGDEALEEQLAALVGRPVGRGGPSVAPDPVNQPMIRHWAAAFADANPVYVDPEAAAGSWFGADRGAAAHAPDLDHAHPDARRASPSGAARRSPSEGDTALSVLDRAGYVGTLATNSEFEIVRYLRLGEVVSSEHRLRVDLRGEADPDGPWPVRHLGDDLHGGLGRGRRPTDVPHPEVRPVRGAGMTGVRSPHGRRTVGGGGGRPCPSWPVDVTATSIAAGAIATRDFMPVHHDRDYATPRAPRTSS